MLLLFLGERGPWSGADCKAGGGSERLDSEEDDVHGLSLATISVEAAGVSGRTGGGMISMMLSLLVEAD